MSTKEPPVMKQLHRAYLATIAKRAGFSSNVAVLAPHAKAAIIEDCVEAGMVRFAGDMVALTPLGLKETWA